MFSQQLQSNPNEFVEFTWSGSVTSSSINVKARLTDDINVKLALSSNIDFSTFVLSDIMSANLATNNRIVSFNMVDLLPSTQYYYTIFYNDSLLIDTFGKAKTFPESADSFSFAFSTCAKTGGNNVVFETIKDLNPLFFIHTGDFHYENIAVNDQDVYRQAYQTVLSSPRQLELYRNIPLIYIWDDHDYGPNNSDKTHIGREAARLIYQEYVPHYPLAEGIGNVPIYHAFSAGRVRFIVTDLRSMKDPFNNMDLPDKSILGVSQKEWFKQQLMDANGVYPIIFWISTSPWIGEESSDGWPGYTHERKEIANFIKDNNIGGIIMLSGDLHLMAIDDGSNSDYADNGGAGFPVFQAGPLDKWAGIAGGPHSHGAYTNRGQFGHVTVNDNGNSQIEVILSGRDSLNTELVSLTFTVSAISLFPEIEHIPDTTINEDEELLIILEADSDLENLITFSAFTNLEELSLSISGDSLHIYPDYNWYGSANITVTASDLNSFSDTINFELTVLPINDAPVFHIIPDVEIDEDNTLSVQLSATDVDGDSLNYFVDSLDQIDLFIVNNQGLDSLLMVPKPDWYGTATINLSVDDGNGLSDQTSFNLIINPIDDDPFISNNLGSLYFNEDFQELWEVNLDDIYTDIDGELNYTVFTSVPAVIRTELDENMLYLSSLENANGITDLIITAFNFTRGSIIDTVLVTVLSENDAPHLSSDKYVYVGIRLEFHIQLDIIDVDSEDLAINLTGGEAIPHWVAISNNNIDGIPEEVGTFPIYITLSDNEISVLDTFNLIVENFVPIITSVTDIPNDQGGRVYVSFNASFFDNGIESNQLYSLFRNDVFDNDSSGWVLLEAGGAVGDQSYTYEATTLNDSLNEIELGLTEFKVVASMDDGIFHSEPMMGYSTDNIDPGVPEGFIANALDNNIQLTWNESNDEDFQYFILEKSINIDFDEFEVIHLAETSYIDINYVLNETNYYRLASVDYAGNQSTYSPVVEATILSINLHLIPDIFALHQNYPNPFNPVTSIRYDLPDNAFVKLTIHDILGSEIKNLINTNQNSGYKSIKWNGTNNQGEPVSAGVYLYKIQAGDFVDTKKMIILK